MIQKIKDTGYQARENDVRLTVTGTLSMQGDQPVLTLTDMKEKRILALAAPSKDRSAFDAAQSRAKAGAADVLEIEGFWQKPDKKAAKDALPVLQVTRIDSGKKGGAEAK
jgi:hypothetical protein